MKRLILIVLALLAVRMAGRAVKQNAEVMAGLWLLLGMTATLNGAGTAKSRSTEQRLNDLIPAVFPNTGGTVSGNMTVAGNHTVAGNVSVGSSLVGPTGSGSTLTVGSPAHFSGVGITADNGVTSHANVAADGNVTAGGNMSVSGNHSVGGQLLGPGGGTLTVGSPTHFSGSGLTTDSTLTSHGSVVADVNVQAAGTLSGGVLVVNGQRIAPGQGRPAFYPVAGGSSPSTASIGVALNEIVGCLIAAGISA
jgi:hypothetical protein